LSIHPEKPFVTSVPFLRDEVAWIMKNRMAVVSARRAVALHDVPSQWTDHPRAPQRFVCAATGAPLTDAVWIADRGIWVTEKAALIHAWPHEVVAGVRDAFEKAVAARCASSLPTGIANPIPWVRQMPVGGIKPFGGARDA
jgi:hypothetical protein